MNTENLILTLLIGAIAGWLAGNIRQGYGYGLVGNIIVGILGAFIGNWISRDTGLFLGAGLLGTILTAVLGALILLFLIGLVRRQKL
ncbi:MAG: GlsB/YeaQ/YmgE family stress response membrane protein [Saprospiraceae bacterium]|nr:GlsB/YeaQ/YmgE family stress response membrane protein [Saprospiraceae bacterium]